MIILIKLLLAHFIGDFILQPNSWIRAKEAKKLYSYQLYLHSLLHGVLVFLLVGEWQFWKWAILIAGIHFLIDAIKILYQKKNTKRAFFFVDQLLHLILIYLIWLLSQKLEFPIASLTNYRAILLLTCIIILTQPVSLGVKTFISKWSPSAEDTINDSLQSAGMYIGILERLFVFAFVITNHWEAIGFLLAAKSVFRFGDLKKSKDRKLTEYILIGTLVSFGIAILIGVFYHELSAIS